MAEKKTTQTKASMRNGRASKSGGVYNANHNTLEVTRKGQPHIDDQKFELNRYWKFEQKDRSFAIHKLDGGKGGFDSRKHELAVYEKLYKVRQIRFTIIHTDEKLEKNIDVEVKKSIPQTEKAVTEEIPNFDEELPVYDEELPVYDDLYDIEF